VAIDAPDAAIPIRTLRHISQNPNFGGEVMVLSLGCEKLPPERLLPPGSIAIGGHVRLHDERHIGFASMVEDIISSAERHLQRLNHLARRHACHRTGHRRRDGLVRRLPGARRR
jgi:galactarate dehydratase